MEVNRLDKQAQDVINDPVSSTKKPNEVSQDLIFDSPASNQRKGRENDEEESVVFNCPLSYSQHHMEIEGKRKELKEAIPECNLDHKKQFLTKRNLSLHSSAPCHKGECNKEKAVLHQSPACSLSPTSLASFEASNRQKLMQREHQNKGLTYRKRMSLAKLCQVGKKQSTGSVDSCQMGDSNNEKMLDTRQPSPSLSLTHFSASGGGLPAAMSIKHNEICPDDTTIDKTGSGSFNRKFPEICPVSKRLSLGPKSSSARPENDDKETMVPILKLPTQNLQTGPTKISNGWKRSLGSLTSLQESDNRNIKQVSNSPNCMDTCNSLSMQHHCWFDGKEQSNRNNGKTDGGIRPQAIEESPITRELIVVDSEDSEEEDVSGSSRLKLSLVRKRMGKRRT